MKTIYTLLLACGLCFTSHAQSNGIYTVDQKKAMLTIQQQKVFNDLLYESLPMVLFSDNKTYKPFSVTNSVNKKIVLEDQYTLTNHLQGYTLSDFQTAEILILQWKEGKTYSIDLELLQNMTNLQYIYLICLDNINATQVSALLHNILNVVGTNVEVIYQVSHEG